MSSCIMDHASGIYAVLFWIEQILDIKRAWGVQLSGL